MLLLPGRSGMFDDADDAVRTGFLTAYENEKQGVIVNLVESGDAPADMFKAYLSTLDGNDIIVGLLSRNGAALISQSGKVSKPTVALTQLEGESDAALQPPMLVAGLSVEEEVRQVAGWTEREKTGGNTGVAKNTAPRFTLFALANRMIAKRRWCALDAQGASSHDENQQMRAEKAAIARDPHAIVHTTHANRTRLNVPHTHQALSLPTSLQY